MFRLAFTLLLAAVLLTAQEKPAAHPPFLTPAQQTEALNMAFPPTAGTILDTTDRMTVLEVQRYRTPDMEAWARSVDEARIWVNAEVLGPDFRPEKLPVCAAFFDRVRSDVYQASRDAKKRYARPRPFKIIPGVKPCVPFSDSPGYPSGHAIQIYSWLDMLVDLFPEKKTELEAFAQRLAWARVVGGVHFPSDLVAGRILVEQLMKAYRATPEFQKGLEACRKELMAAGMRKAA